MPVLKNQITHDYAAYNGDCVEVWRDLPADSIDFTVYSPPFCNLYIYSDSCRDMGNAADDAEFFAHYAFLLAEIYRTTVPGRLTAVHCKDLPLYRGRDGACGLKDFPGQIIAAHESVGFTFHSRVTVWKCPVTERERTNNNGLLHKTVMRDSSQVRQGMADYLLTFRKTPHGENGNLSDKPIVRPTGYERWIGGAEDDPRTSTAHPSPYARTGLIDEPSISLHRRYAEPVWWDIDQTDVLNYELARGENDERHICPLQLGLIRRAVYLWSQEGDTVASPFMGIGSEGYVALGERRRFIGAELKPEYFGHAVKHLDKAIAERDAPRLFGGPTAAAAEPPKRSAGPPVRSVPVRSVPSRPPVRT